MISKETSDKIDAEMTDALLKRVRRYAGKRLKEVRNPCITAREAIWLANYLVKLEADYNSSATNKRQSNDNT